MPQYKLYCGRCNKEWESKRPLDPCPQCRKKDERELKHQIEGTADLVRRKESIENLEISGMPVETINSYNPKHKLPLYTKITDSRFNDYKVGKEYEIRIQDEKEQEDEVDPYNFVHESILIAKRKVKLGDIENELLAFDSHKIKKSEAIEEIQPDAADWDEDTKVLLCVFLRKDKVQDFVQSGMEVIKPGFDKEDVQE